MKLKIAKQNEIDFCNLLNALPDRRAKVAKYEFECFDVWSTKSDSVYQLFEVKLRRPNDWTTWYLEVDKVLAMAKKKYESLAKGNTLQLFNTVSCDGKHYIYRISDIINYKTKYAWMNKTTADGFHRQGEKVKKLVFEFPKHICINVLE